MAGDQLDQAQAEHLVREWAASPYQIHKRPPFRAYDFDGVEQVFFVVGSTGVSVVDLLDGSRSCAERVAGLLNQAQADAVGAV